MGFWWHNLTTWFEVRPAPPPTPPPPADRSPRSSLGLQEVLPILTETPHPAVLDLGCVWQSTVACLTGSGSKLYTEDLFLTLSQMEEEDGANGAPPSERLVRESLQYPEQSFRGILAWDLFDYLPDGLLKPLAARLHALLERGGVCLGLFSNRLPGNGFVRYRVVDSRLVELMPGTLPLVRRRAFQNRELLHLFSSFRFSRTFIGRDHLRELLLIK